jgi:hypothetical protein
MQSIRSRDKRHSASPLRANLVRRFQSANLTRGLTATVAEAPDTTLEDLALLVDEHPQLAGVTLEQLLVELRRQLRARVEAMAHYGGDPDVERLALLLEELVRKNREVVQRWRHEIEPRTSPTLAMPKVEVSTEAARRIDRHEWAVADYVVKGVREALRLGFAKVGQVIIVPVNLETPGYPDKGIMISFGVGLTGDRDALRAYLIDLQEGLPLEIWAGL